MEQAGDDVGDLDAGVVEIVLHLDVVAQEALAADEDVAEHGVAQVADVRRLVGVDVGVLDDDLARTAGPGPRQPSRSAATKGPRAIRKFT